MVRSVGLGPPRESKSSVPASGFRGVSRTLTHSELVAQPPANTAAKQMSAIEHGSFNRGLWPYCERTGVLRLLDVGRVRARAIGGEQLGR